MNLLGLCFATSVTCAVLVGGAFASWTERCTLECQNGGICRWRESSEIQIMQSQRFRYMACDCPSGFGGQDCNITVIRCPDGHMCFHGSTCKKSDVVSNDVLDKYQCDCSTAPPNVVVVGTMCQHKETSSCESGVKLSTRSFCTNGGRCRKYIDPSDDDMHHGCDCAMGFDGPYCDSILGDANTEQGGWEDEFSFWDRPGLQDTNDIVPGDAVVLSETEYANLAGKKVAIGIGTFIALLACVGVLIGSIIITRTRPSGDITCFKHGGDRVDAAPEGRLDVHVTGRLDVVSGVTDSFVEIAEKAEAVDMPNSRAVCIVATPKTEPAGTTHHVRAVGT